MSRSFPILLLLLLSSGLAACSTRDPQADCVAAFRDAEPRAEPPYQASPLDDAIRRCQDVASWRAAWNAVPGAHPTSADSIGFLRDRCQVEALALTELCSQLAEDPSTPPG